MTCFRRRLPHDYRPDADLFLTWHLHGSLPATLYPPPHKQSSGEAFVWMDRYLDTASKGPMYLRKREVAEVVIESLYKGVALNHYHLHAFVLMPNHVHLLVSPLIHPSLFMKSLKGTTARNANRLLHLTGNPFWQAESYDRWVRTPEEFDRIRAYIERNPVKAGLAPTVEAYEWSSAHPRFHPRDPAGISR